MAVHKPVTIYIDTALSALYLCVERTCDGQIAEYKGGDLRASDMLHKILLELLSDMDASVDDIVQVIVVRGPGSFTGVRIAYAFIEALKITHTGVDVKAVDTLEAFLHTNEMLLNEPCIGVMTNAHGGQCFYQTFEKDSDDKYQPVGPVCAECLENVDYETWQQTLVVEDINILNEQCIVGESINILGMKKSMYHSNYNPVYIKPLAYKKIES